MQGFPEAMEIVEWQRIAVPDEGGAVCFDLRVEHRMRDGRVVEIGEQGFVVRFQGRLRAWRNVCPHAGSPLDWIPGRFFSEDGTQLLCHTHGASFDPLTGDCLAGPCERGLDALPLEIEGEQLRVPRLLRDENRS